MTSQSTPPSPSLQSALTALSHHLSHLSPPPPPSFSSALIQLLTPLYTPHWTPSNPSLSSAYRSLSQVQLLNRSGVAGLDARIRKAVADCVSAEERGEAELKVYEGMRNWLGDWWVIWVDPGSVSVRGSGIGKGAVVVEIWGDVKGQFVRGGVKVIGRKEARDERWKGEVRVNNGEEGRKWWVELEERRREIEGEWVEEGEESQKEVERSEDNDSVIDNESFDSTSFIDIIPRPSTPTVNNFLSTIVNPSPARTSRAIPILPPSSSSSSQTPAAPPTPTSTGTVGQGLGLTVSVPQTTTETFFVNTCTSASSIMQHSSTSPTSSTSSETFDGTVSDVTSCYERSRSSLGSEVEGFEKVGWDEVKKVEMSLLISPCSESSVDQPERAKVGIEDSVETIHEVTLGSVVSTTPPHDSEGSAWRRSVVDVDVAGGEFVTPVKKTSQALQYVMGIGNDNNSTLPSADQSQVKPPQAQQQFKFPSLSITQPTPLKNQPIHDSTSSEKTVTLSSESPVRGSHTRDRGVSVSCGIVGNGLIPPPNVMMGGGGHRRGKSGDGAGGKGGRDRTKSSGSVMGLGKPSTSGNKSHNHHTHTPTSSISSNLSILSSSNQSVTSTSSTSRPSSSLSDRSTPSTATSTSQGSSGKDKDKEKIQEYSGGKVGVMSGGVKLGSLGSPATPTTPGSVSSRGGTPISGGMFLGGVQQGRERSLSVASRGSSGGVSLGVGVGGSTTPGGHKRGGSHHHHHHNHQQQQQFHPNAHGHAHGHAHQRSISSSSNFPVGLGMVRGGQGNGFVGGMGMGVGGMVMNVNPGNFFGGMGGRDERFF